MSVPEFNTYEDVQRFLRNGGDAWYYTMVEEYMDMIAGDLSVEEFDIEELNGWIENELTSVQRGYENYVDQR
mgnify:FL=1|tara:strand:+ start:292 stop:507 length:216 start_codon:yes stop_codon:yes gene_type:complete